MALEFKSGIQDCSSAAGLHPVGWHGDGYADNVPTPVYNPLIASYSAVSAVSAVSVPKPVVAFELDLQEALPEVPSSRFPPPIPFQTPPPVAFQTPPPQAYRVDAAAVPRNTSFFTQVTRAGMLARGRKRPMGGWPY